MPSALNLAGQRFGRLTALRRADNHKNQTRWLCRCECGVELSVLTCSLRTGNTQSCGCLQRERSRKHGCWRHPLFKIWGAMMSRCYNQKDRGFKHYGARGIRVCKRWHDPKNFVADMPPKPSPKHTLERRNNNRGYSPSNCIWATQIAQARNTRRNRLITFRGERRCLKEWSEVLGLSYQALHRRLNQSGWSVERALSTPIGGA